MQYRNCHEAGQGTVTSPDRAADAAPHLADANINPATGLATDYLNHFNEAIMLLELLPSCPDCLADFLTWRPVSYREHFLASRFRGRDLAIAAYDAADPLVRETFDRLAETMIDVLEATRSTMTSGMSPPAICALAECSAAWLKTLIAHAGAVINGEVDTAAAGAPQAVVDGLMQRSL